MSKRRKLLEGSGHEKAQWYHIYHEAEEMDSGELKVVAYEDCLLLLITPAAGALVTS